MAESPAEGTLAQPVVGSLAELAASAAARASGLGDSVGATAFGRMNAPREGALRLDVAVSLDAPSSLLGGAPSEALAGASEARAEEA